MGQPEQDYLGNQAPPAVQPDPLEGASNPMQMYLGSETPSLPYDLAAAILGRFEAQAPILGGITGIYEKQAGDKATTPYLVFSIVSGNPILTTDIHYVFDQRVKFTVYANTQDEANMHRAHVAKAFGTGSYDFQTGFSIPFFQVNQAEGKAQGRGSNAKYMFESMIEYSARTHRS